MLRPELVLILVALIALAFFAFRSLRYTTPISSVHPKSRPSCADCKFDRDEAKRKLAKPPIDTSNLPAPSPVVQKLLNAVSVTEVERVIRELSGESPASINGAQVTIATRNSYTTGVGSAMDYVEQFYRGLAGFTVTRHQYSVRGRKMYNLVAERPGRKTPNKVLILGAHLDSTAGSTWRAEPVAPGADDDASGTAALMQIAAAIAQLQPDVTIRFVHFTGEEQGLWGSTVYSDVVAKEQIEVIGMFEMDMIGYCSKPGNRVDIHDDVDAKSHELVVSLVRNAVRYGLNLRPVDTHNHAVQGRSDHAPFQDHGFRAVLISEEFSDDGFNPNYHSKTDRVSALNLPYTVEVIRMLLATVCDMSGIQ